MVSINSSPPGSESPCIISNSSPPWRLSPCIISELPQKDWDNKTLGHNSRSPCRLEPGTSRILGRDVRHCTRKWHCRIARMLPHPVRARNKSSPHRFSTDSNDNKNPDLQWRHYACTCCTHQLFLVPNLHFGNIWIFQGQFHGSSRLKYACTATAVSVKRQNSAYCYKKHSIGNANVFPRSVQTISPRRLTRAERFCTSSLPAKYNA